MNSSPQPRYCKRLNFYNMLQFQDFRHVLVIDFRSAYSDLHIRQSFGFYGSNDQNQLHSLLEAAEKLNSTKQQKYKLKKVRRVVVLDETPIPLDDPRIRSFVQPALPKEYKLYVLECSFKDFVQKYPFLCLDPKKLETEKHAAPSEHQKSKAAGISEAQMKILYSMAKFPFEIVEDKLFLGSIYASNNLLMLRDLRISGLIDLVDYKSNEEKPSQFKTQEGGEFQYYNIPLPIEGGLEVDFDQICELINRLSENGRVLIYCKNGESISPALAIAYLMYKQNQKCDMASLRVFQWLGSVQIAKWIYTQVLLYHPAPTV